MATTLPVNDSQQLVDAANNQAAAGTALVNQQNQQGQQLLSGYNSTIAPLNQQITGLNNQMSGVQQSLNDLHTNVINQTKGTLTTAGQEQEKENAQGSNLNQQLGDLGLAEAPLTTQVNQATQQYQMAAQQQQAYFASQTSMFDQTSANQLSAITAKIQRGEQVSDEEYQQANALALQAASFNSQMAIANVNNAASQARVNTEAGVNTNINPVGEGPPNLGTVKIPTSAQNTVVGNGNTTLSTLAKGYSSATNTFYQSDGTQLTIPQMAIQLSGDSSGGAAYNQVINELDNYFGMAPSNNNIIAGQSAAGQ